MFKLGHPVFGVGIRWCICTEYFYRNGVNFLWRLDVQKTLDERLRLHLLKSRASPDMLPLSLCNKIRVTIWHTNRPLISKTLSILSYDIGK